MSVTLCGAAVDMSRTASVALAELGSVELLGLALVTLATPGISVVFGSVLSVSVLPSSSLLYHMGLITPVSSL